MEKRDGTLRRDGKYLPALLGRWRETVCKGRQTPVSMCDNLALIIMS